MNKTVTPRTMLLSPGPWLRLPADPAWRARRGLPGWAITIWIAKVISDHFLRDMRAYLEPQVTRCVSRPYFLPLTPQRHSLSGLNSPNEVAQWLLGYVAVFPKRFVIGLARCVG